MDRLQQKVNLRTAAERSAARQLIDAYEQAVRVANWQKKNPDGIFRRELSTISLLEGRGVKQYQYSVIVKMKGTLTDMPVDVRVEIYSDKKLSWSTVSKMARKDAREGHFATGYKNQLGLSGGWEILSAVLISTNITYLSR